MPNTWVGLLLIFKDSGPTHFCVTLAARLEQSSDLTLAALVKKNNKSSTRVSDLNPHHTDKILGCWQCSGGGLSYIFRTLNSIPFFPDQSQYHQIFTLSGLFWTCQAPGPAAKVDPRGGYSLCDGWYICAAVLTPFFHFGRIEHDLFGVFFSSTNSKAIFWGTKTTNFYKNRSFWPQIQFFPRSFWVQFSAASGTPPSVFRPSTPPGSWPDCSLRPFPLPSSYMHVVANKLENRCPSINVTLQSLRFWNF